MATTDGSLLFDTKIDNNGFQSGLSKLGKLGKTAGKVVTGAIAGASAAVVAFGGYSVKVGSDFSAAMSEVGAISGATGEELQALRDKAKEMGSTTKFSATESAEALKYMSMAGWDTRKMLDGLPGIMNLAAASGEELATVSDIVTDAMTAFGLKADQAGHFADVLAMASSKSNTNVSMLGESFKYVAPLAGSLGYSAEDAAVALGLMANAGIKSSQSGTSLRSALTRLVKPTSEASGLMKKYGISMTNSDGSMKSLDQVMGNLRKSFSGLTEAEKAQVASTLFGQEAMSGMLSIINASDEDFNNLTQSIGNADGAAQDMADTMQDNLNGDITKLKSAVEGLGIELYESVDNPLRDVAKNAQGYVGQLTDAFKSNGLEGMVSTFGDILSDMIAQITGALPKMVSAGVKMIQGLISGLNEQIPTIANSAIDIVNTLLDGFISLLPELIQLGADLITNLGNSIGENAPNLMTKILQLIISIADKIIENIPTIANAGLNIIKGLAQGIADNLPFLIENVPRIINDFSDAIYGLIPEIIKTGVQIIWALITGLIQSIPTIIANIPEIIMAIVNVFTLYNWWNLGKGVITKLGEGIKGMGGNIKAKALELAGKAKDGIASIFKGAPEWGKNMVSNLGIAIKNMGSTLKSKAKELAQKAIDAIKDKFSWKNIKSIGENLVKGIWNGISNITGWILDKIRGFGGKIVSKIETVFGINSPSTVMRDQVGAMLTKGIGVGIMDEMGGLNKQVEKEMGNLAGKMQATVNAETTLSSNKISGGSVPVTSTSAQNRDNSGNDAIREYHIDLPLDKGVLGTFVMRTVGDNIEVVDQKLNTNAVKNERGGRQ